MTRKPIGRLWRPATQRLIGQKHWGGALLYGITRRPWSRVSQQLVDVDAELEAAASGASGSGLEGMRRGIELLREQNVLWFDGLLKMALAEAEAQWGDAGRAVAIFDETLATCDRTGCRAFEAELHRARGEMLLKCDPASPALAEKAFLTAIAVSRQQGAPSFELRAALSLAELYQSTARPVEAHDILAHALDGFSPTVEMPEIAEAQALLTEGLWAPGTQDGSQRLPGGAEGIRTDGHRGFRPSRWTKNSGRCPGSS
jgi:predicted ATPase